jgi:hypothetical protein
MALNKVLWVTPLVVIAYDTTASLASLSLGFTYAYAGIGSAIIYATGGFFAASAAGFKSSILVGVVAGLTDATIGWGISWAIGPGRPASGSLSTSQWFVAASSVAIVAIVCAAIGGLIAHLVQARGVA